MQRSERPVGKPGECMFPGEKKCGTLATYTNHKCRGDDCTSANRTYYLETRPAKQVEKGKLCTLEWCERPEFARGLCHTCFERVRRRMHREKITWEESLLGDDRGRPRRYLGVPQV